MEISLNLLPPSLLLPREAQAKRRRLALVIAGVILPILLVYLALNVRISILRADIAQIDRLLTPLRPVTVQVHQLESDLEALHRREDTLSKLTHGVPHWSVILVQLSRVVPPNVWFTNLSLDSSDRLAIRGRALSQVAVSTLATRLADARLLTNVTLKFIREETRSPRRTFTFEIDGTLRPGAGTP